MNSLSLDSLCAWYCDHLDELTHAYHELLRFPTIGADPKRLGDCASCAAWLKRYLRKMGFEVELVQSELSAPPVLYAIRKGSAPQTVLLYGHYDVQPPDPESEWETPPFEPTRKSNGRTYCRGAQDDKGQFFAALSGFQAAIDSGQSVPTLKVVLEGQEESGSGALTALLSSPEFSRDRLAADVLLVCDTGEHASGRPAIVAGLRGVVHWTVTLEGPAYDLHSGLHGGLAPNPAQGMAQLLSSLYEPSGRVAVAGFYDTVKAPTERELALAEEVPFDAEAYRQTCGCPPVGGEANCSPVMRNSFLPTLEVNGVHSGYGGPGSKTVIPSKAIAKLSMRLVPNQSPQEVLNLVLKHLQSHVPRGCKVSFSEITGLEPGFRLPIGTPVDTIAREVLTRIDPRGPVYKWEGASIPVVARLRAVSGAAPLLVGWGREEDKIHCPNESFGDDQFLKALQWAALIITELAKE